jgi:hypothetical protein
MSNVVTICYDNKKCQISKTTLSQFQWLQTQISTNSTINLDINAFLFDQLLEGIRTPLSALHESFSPALEYLLTGVFPKDEFVTINAGGKSFCINKEFLAKVSPYFEILLSGNFKEATQDEIFIDVSPKGFSAILKYLFSGITIPPKYSYLIDYFNISTTTYVSNYEEISKELRENPPIKKLERPSSFGALELPRTTANPQSGLINLAANSERVSPQAKVPKRIRKIMESHETALVPSAVATTQMTPTSIAMPIIRFPLLRGGYDLIDRMRIYISSAISPSKSTSEITKFWPFNVIENIKIMFGEWICCIYDKLTLFVLEEVRNTEYVKALERSFRKRENLAMLELDFTHKFGFPIVCVPWQAICLEIEFIRDIEIGPVSLEVDTLFLHGNVRDTIGKNPMTVPHTFYDTQIVAVKNTITEIYIHTRNILSIIMGCFYENPVDNSWKFYPISRFKLYLQNNPYIDLCERSLISKMMHARKRECLLTYPIYEWSVEHLDAAINSGKIRDVFATIEISNEIYEMDQVQKSIFLIVQYTNYICFEQGMAGVRYL